LTAIGSSMPVTVVPMQVGQVPQQFAGVTSSQRAKSGSSEMSLERSMLSRLLPGRAGIVLLQDVCLARGGGYPAPGTQAARAPVR